jgi:hypothetical protein
VIPGRFCGRLPVYNEIRMLSDILQRHYESFINEKDQQSYLAGLFDYVEFILGNKECGKVIAGIQVSKKKLFDEESRLKGIVVNEVEASKKEMSESKEFFKEVGIKTSEKASDNDFDTDKLIYSESYPKLSEIEKRIKNEEVTSSWGAWDRIYATYLEYKAHPLKQNLEVCEPSLVTRLHNQLLNRMGNSEQSDNQPVQESEENVVISDDDKTAFEITYNETYRRVYVNGMEIKKFSGSSEKSRPIFEEVYNNANQAITIKPGGSRGYNLVNSFGFKGESRKLFFPIVTESTIMLKNPIKVGDLKKLGIEDITLEELFTQIK